MLPGSAHIPKEGRTGTLSALGGGPPGPAMMTPLTGLPQDSFTCPVQSHRASSLNKHRALESTGAAV